MKRDMNLIRELLLTLEAAATDRGFSFEEGEAETLKYTLDQIRYNLQQAEEMGLIVVGSKPLNGEWKILRLTPRGHDFLESGRNTEQNHLSSVTLYPASDDAVTTKSEKTQGELLTLRPTLWGLGIDLKEFGRRVRRWGSRVWARKNQQ
jgi:Hypothetical protein (DUF2513)